MKFAQLLVLMIFYMNLFLHNIKIVQPQVIYINKVYTTLTIYTDTINNIKDYNQSSSTIFFSSASKTSIQSLGFSKFIKS